MAANENKTNVDEQAKKLRMLFASSHTADIDKGLYDERDIEKYNTDDNYVVSFIRFYESLQDACDHLHESLKFRKEMGLNDCKAEDFEVEYWENGGLYYHNHDKDGHRILYLQVKQHKKDPQILPTIKKFFAYHLETHYRQNPDASIVLLFDLAGAGLAQLDMDFIKYVINCFKLYYPKLLEYMLMYEMPWLFNAAWKVIKQMLHPESVKRIKFVNKSDIQEYINKDQLWEHMGGTDKYVYSYDREKQENGDGDVADSIRKRVTFADQDAENGDTENKISAKNNNNNIGSATSIMRRGPSSTQSRQRKSKGDNSFIGRLLTICPAEELEFVVENETSEACDNIILKNTLPYSIAFKVKTTSPEKYRVRPSSGFVKPGSETEVSIQLQQGYQNTVHKDKFLIMAMEVANESNRSFSELWKAVQKDSIMEHRLRCIVTSSKDQSLEKEAYGSPQASSQLTKQVETLLTSNQRLERMVQLLLCGQLILTVLFLVVILYWFFFYDSSSDDSSSDVSHASQQCLKP